MNDQMIPPAGVKPGCLPRKSRFGQWADPLADHVEVIPRRDWRDLIGKISLRPRVPVVLDQDGVGSCATESATGAVHLIRALYGLPHVLLNPWFVYHTTSGGRDAGSSIDQNLAFIRENGIAPDSVWPRSKGWRARPSAEAQREARKYRIHEFYDIGSWEEFGTALLLGFPVVWGYSGHSILAVGLKDEDTIIYLNSWGNWGDGGFGTARARSIVWGYGAWAVRSVLIPSDELPIPTPADTGGADVGR